MKIEKIEMYRTSDGAVFNTEKEAKSHLVLLEAEIRLRSSQFMIHGDLRGIREVKELQEFLNEQRQLIFALMAWSYDEPED